MMLRKYLELIRFSHTLFALPFAILALIWAIYYPAPSVQNWTANSWMRWVGIVLCMVFARSFAMAVNRWADASFDAKNPRTAMRHIPAGTLSSSSVLAFALLNAALFVLSCLLFLPNKLPILLSLPVLLFLGGYSYAKRFFDGVHFWLGAALMLAPICTWLAIRGEVVQAAWQDIFPPLFLGLGVLLWVTGFDIIYACQDESFDRQHQLRSIPARWGARRALHLSAALHAAAWGVWLLLGWAFPGLSLGWIWYACLLGIGILLIQEHRWVSPTDLSRVNQAFFHLNVAIGALLLIAGGLDAWWQ
jgi:4-hydroxybenzoate polyprenyltransferase